MYDIRCERRSRMFGFGQKIESITIDELMTIENKRLIDVREQNEFECIHISDAQNIPMFGLMMNADQFLNKAETYYLICQSGNRSHQVCLTLAQQGYKVINVRGGMSEYMQKYGKK